MASEANPTVRRRELAKYFRELRHERGYQLEQVAEALGASLAKASRLESGARGISVADARTLSEFYELPDAERDRIMEIATESRLRGWWQRVDLPTPLRTFIGMEQSALAINEYSTSVVPGLLQTPEYAAAAIEGDLDVTPEKRQPAVDVRLARQRVLRRSHPPVVWIVLDEAALARIVGSRLIMRTQLEHLHEVTAQPAVTIQLIPFDAGAHPGINSDFILLELSDDRLSDVVYVEGLAGSFFKDAPDDVRRYRRAWAQLRAIALSPQESRKLIEEMAYRLLS